MRVTFAVRVHPRAKKERHHRRTRRRAEGLADRASRRGRANEACIEFFAKLLKVPRSSVTIASGQTSRNKVIRVAGLTAQQVRERLG